MIRLCALVLIMTLAPALAGAQSLGAFRWQQQPYCNVLTLTVSQLGGVFTLDGFDDQCGAGQRASVAGTAFLNPDGSIGLGLAIVTAPAGTPLHVDVTLSLATVSGTWRDSAGGSERSPSIRRLSVARHDRRRRCRISSLAASSQARRVSLRTAAS